MTVLVDHAVVQRGLSAVQTAVDVHVLIHIRELVALVFIHARYRVVTRAGHHTLVRLTVTVRQQVGLRPAVAADTDTMIDIALAVNRIGTLREHHHNVLVARHCVAAHLVCHRVGYLGRAFVVEIVRRNVVGDLKRPLRRINCGGRRTEFRRIDFHHAVAIRQRVVVRGRTGEVQHGNRGRRDRHGRRGLAAVGIRSMNRVAAVRQAVELIRGLVGHTVQRVFYRGKAVRCRNCHATVVTADLVGMGGDVEGKSINRQRQRHDAVAVVDGRQVLRVGRRTCSGRCDVEAVLAVRLAQADLTGQRCGDRLVNRQRQGDNTVAVVNRRQVLRVGHRARGGRRLVEAVLTVSFAKTNLGIEVSRLNRVRRQRQVHDAVTAVDRRQGLRVRGRARSRRREVETVLIVRLAQTNLGSEVGRLDRMRRQRQVHDAVAAMDRRQGQNVRGRTRYCRREVEAVRVVRLAQTNLGSEVGCRNWMRRQRQVHDAVAAMDRRQGLRVCGRTRSRRRQIEAVSVVRLAQADLGSEVGCLHRMRRQRQVHDAVAAMDRRQGLRVRGRTRSRRRQIEAVSVVSFAQTNLGSEVGRLNRVRRQRQVHDAVATMDRRQGLRMRGRARNRRRQVEAVLVVGLSQTNLGIEVGRLDRMRRQRQVHDAVAAMDCRQGLRVRGHARYRRREVEAVRVVSFAQAYLGIEVGRLDRMRRQRQVHDAVAAMDCRQGLRVRGRTRYRRRQIEAVLIISFAQTNLGIEVGRLDRMRRQRQVHDAVAAMDRRQSLRMRRRTRYCRREVEAVLTVSFAKTNLGIEVSRLNRVRRQRQVHDAVATVHRCQSQIVRGRARYRRCKVKAVLTVSFAKTNLGSEVGRRNRVRRQRQIHNTVATMDCRQGLRVRGRTRSRWREVEAVRVVRLAQTNLGIEVGRLNRMRRQRQVHDAVATMNRRQGLRVRGRARYRRREVEAVRVVRLAQANLGIEVGRLDRVRRQRQVHDAVAAIDRCQGLRVRGCTRSRRREVKAVFIVSFAQANLGSEVGRLDWVRRQRQVHDAVATMNRRQGLRMRGRARYRRCKVKAVRIVHLAQANLGSEVGCLDRMRRQRQVHDAVATMDRRQGLRVRGRTRYRRRQIEAVLIVRLAKTYLGSEISRLNWMRRQRQVHDAVAAIDRRQGLRVCGRTRSRRRQIEAVLVVRLA